MSARFRQPCPLPPPEPVLDVLEQWARELKSPHQSSEVITPIREQS